MHTTGYGRSDYWYVFYLKFIGRSIKSQLFKLADAAQQFDDTTKANMIALAVEFRQVEKNTPPVSFHPDNNI